MTSALFLPSPDHFHTSPRLIPHPISLTFLESSSLSFTITRVTAFLFYLSPGTESGKRNPFFSLPSWKKSGKMANEMRI